MCVLPHLNFVYTLITNELKAIFWPSFIGDNDDKKNTVIKALINSFRLTHVGFVLAREGVFTSLNAQDLPPFARPVLAITNLIARKNTGHRANRLKRAFAKLGPSHVKLGQFMATRPDIVGLSLARDLETLQDRMPSFSLIEARAIIEKSFGAPVETFFSKFEPAIAAASIAQVHKAQIGTKTVAVKILRSGIAEQFKQDLHSFYFAARLLERFVPKTTRLKPVGVVDTLARSIALEMDLRLEAAALSEMRENTANDTGIRIPKPDWERTSSDVLTMDWIEGIPLSDIAALKASHINLPKLGDTVIQSFLRHAMRDGFFHADMHQGNLFSDSAGNLVLVDFGIMGRIGLKERQFLAEILYGFITRNYLRVAQVHFEAGYVPAHHSIETFAQAIRAIGEPIHSRTADQISMAKLFTMLFEITDLFDMQTRTELVMLQKTMVVVEGVARNLNPKLNMWATAEPVVREWIERNLGPLGKLRELGEGGLALAGILSNLPHMISRGEQFLTNIEANLAVKPPLKNNSMRSLTLAVWAIAGLLAYMLWHG